MRWLSTCLGAAALLSCAPGANVTRGTIPRGTSPAPPSAPSSSSPASSAGEGAPASSGAPTAPVVPKPASGARLTEVLGPSVLGESEVGFELWPIDDGLLVTRGLPAGAFLVTGGEAKPLPGYFDGLHTPVKDWEAMDFQVLSVKGKLADLSFVMDAPASGEQREVRGTTRHWKVGTTTPREPAWIAPDVVSTPLALPSGGSIYERAAGYQSPASLGFRFLALGSSKGVTLPVPAPGTNGCKHRLLGHPFLQVLSDGSILGIGTECKSGADLVSTAKVDGVGWPYQMLVPRVGVGTLMAEIWSGKASRVLPLPGAESIAEFSGVAISARDARDVVVVAQKPGKSDSVAYVAQYDGAAFREITPPNPPFWLEPVRDQAGTLLLLGDAVVFRRNGGGWDTVRLEVGGKDDRCNGFGPSRIARPTSEGATYLAGFGPCLWRLPLGGMVAARVPLPDDAMLGDLVVFDGSAFALVSHERSASLYRLGPP